MSEGYMGYNMLNFIDSHFPIQQMVSTRDNQTFFMYRRYLFEKAISVFSLKLPEWWSTSYTLICLYAWGFLGVFESKKFGVIPQWGTLTGYNLYYQPKKFICSNPALEENVEKEIGVDCELIKLTPDYVGVIDLINYYAALLSVCARTANINVLNSMLSYVFSAKNKASATAYKLMFDKIMRGEPAVVQDAQLLDKTGNVGWQTFSQNLNQNYIANDVLVTMRKIENMFDTDFGIPNANTDKREHLTTDEINANNVQTFCKAELWFDSIKRSFDRINNMFDLDLGIEWKIAPSIDGKGVTTEKMEFDEVL